MAGGVVSGTEKRAPPSLRLPAASTSDHVSACAPYDRAAAGCPLARPPARSSGSGVPSIWMATEATPLVASADVELDRAAARRSRRPRAPASRDRGGVRSMCTVNGSVAAGEPLASAPPTVPACTPSPSAAADRQRLGCAPAMPGWYCEPVAGAVQPDEAPSLASQTAPTPDSLSAIASVAHTSPWCQAPSSSPPPSTQARPGAVESSTVTSRRTSVT